MLFLTAFVFILAVVSPSFAQCSYDSIDFSPLINSATDWVGQDTSSYYYRFNVCRTTVLTYSGSSCPTGYSAYQLGTATGTSPCYANLGTSTSSTWSKTATGYALKYGNGRTCGGVAGTFTIKFDCNPSAPVVPPSSPYFIVSQNGQQCNYEVAMPTSLVCTTNSASQSRSQSAVRNCGVDSYYFGGISLDSTAEPYFGNDTNGYEYQFNICAPVDSYYCGTGDHGIVAFQFLLPNVPATCTALGGVYSSVEPYWRLEGDPVQPDVVVTYYGGSFCGDKERTVTYRFVCGTSYFPVGSHTFVEKATCEYEVVLRTSLACPSA